MDETLGMTNTTKTVKMVNIMVQFVTVTDEEAIAVKKAVNDAVGQRPNTRIQFSIMDQQGPN
jgi:hypothetical protein